MGALTPVHIRCLPPPRWVRGSQQGGLCKEQAIQTQRFTCLIPGSRCSSSPGAVQTQPCTLSTHFPPQTVASRGTEVGRGCRVSGTSTCPCQKGAAVLSQQHEAVWSEAPSPLPPPPLHPHPPSPGGAWNKVRSRAEAHRAHLSNAGCWRGWLLLSVLISVLFCLFLPDWPGGPVITRLPQLPVRVLLASVLPQALG